MMRRRAVALVLFSLAGFAMAVAGKAQDSPPAPAVPAADESKDTTAGLLRPIESFNIINLPSVEVPKQGTMTFFVTHRFRSPLQNSDIHNFYSLDDGADVGIGLGYAPFRNFNVSFYRSSFNSLGIYELDGRYQLPGVGPFDFALRVGDDLRTAQFIQDRSTFFVQGIIAVQLGNRVRLTAVPTYLAKTSGQPSYRDVPPPGLIEFSVDPEPEYRNVFNVPVAASIALTGSITIHGEVVPSYGRTVRVTQTFPQCDSGPCPTISQDSRPGVGWRVSVEKALLRHRFAFTVGNLQETTADQYLVSNYSYVGGTARSIRFGFNLMRQWKVK